MRSGRIDGTVEFHSDQYTFYLDWTAQPITEDNCSNVTAYLCIYNRNVAKNGFSSSKEFSVEINIDGNLYKWTRTFDLIPNYWPENPYTIGIRSARIPHEEDGTKTFFISAKMDVDIINPKGEHVGPGECKCEATRFDLDPIPRTPSAPPYLTADMRRDGSILLSWGASSGYVTGYDLEYLYSDPNTNAYSSWIPLASTTSTSYLDGSENWAAGTGFTYHVRARNGNLASAWTDTGWVYRKGGLYVNSGGERKFGTVYAPGTPPLKAKGVFIGNANGVPVESIRTTDEKNRPIL